MVSRNTIPRFRQFSLRFGVGLFLAICILFGFAARWYHGVRRRGDVQQAFAAKCVEQQRLGKLRMIASYADEGKVDSTTQFLRKWVHPEYGREFRYVAAFADPLAQTPSIDPRLFFGVEDFHLMIPVRSTSIAAFFEIPNLKQLRIEAGRMLKEESDVVDWTRVRSARNLEVLVLESSIVEVDLATELSDLPELSKVSLYMLSPGAFAKLASSPKLSDLSVGLLLPGGPRQKPLSEEETRAVRRSLKAAFDELANRSQLDRLSLSGRLPVTPTDLSTFCDKSSVKELTLRYCQVAPEVLAEFAKLPDLEKLDIHDPKLEDGHLAGLVGAKKLKSISVGPEISGEAIVVLREKMPQCEIWRK